MDKTILTIGIVSLLSSLGIIYYAIAGLNSKGDITKSEIKALLDKCELNLNQFSDFGHGYFHNNISQVQRDAINLKISIEQILGFDAKSEIDLEYYKRPTNDIGIQLVKNDLESLKRQLNKIYETK